VKTTHLFALSSHQNSAGACNLVIRLSLPCYSNIRSMVDFMDLTTAQMSPCAHRHCSITSSHVVDTTHERNSYLSQQSHNPYWRLYGVSESRKSAQYIRETWRLPSLCSGLSSVTLAKLRAFLHCVKEQIWTLASRPFVCAEHAPGNI
jgi:hypothetical protein